MTGFPNANILIVNLSSGIIEKKVMPAETYILYPGGAALGTYILLNELKPGIDPLSEDNILVFSVSPIVGLPIAGANRMTVTTKSPLTGTIGDSQAGGFFPAGLKGNGWDAVVFTGKSKQPVYLYIDGDNAELRPATSMWGKVTGEAEALIKNENEDQDLEIAQIGPAGENMVRFSSIINMSNRANGRNGTGAVMGSKNLKAIAIKKQRIVKVFDKKGFADLVKRVSNNIQEYNIYEALKKEGTNLNLDIFNQTGYLATNNWNTGYLENGSQINGAAFTEQVLLERDTCFSCPVYCKRVVKINGVVDPHYGGPEYETCGALGAYCGITDIKALSLANQLCNMYGMDTITCGATIAFAMECFENGIINSNDIGGIELCFGNGDAAVELIKKIAQKDGIGKLLADGSYRASLQLGPETEKFLTTVKGQELPAHMPQGKAAVGLIYAVNPFGADHQSSEHDPMLLQKFDSPIRTNLRKVGIWKGAEVTSLETEKVRFAFNTQCFYSVADILCLCQFIAGPAWQAMGPSEIVELCKYGTGWDTSVFELMLAGERKINMMRYFNAVEGFTSKDDYLPEKIYKPLQDGSTEGNYIDKEEFEKAKLEYYKLAGWANDTGNPTDETLNRLSLSWVKDKYR